MDKASEEQLRERLLKEREQIADEMQRHGGPRDRGSASELADSEDRAAALGDFMVDDLGGPYGATILSNIIHGMSPAEIPALFTRLAQVIEPGGLIVIKDMFIDDTGVGPEVGVFFGLMMLMYTDGGQSYQVPTVSDWLEESGFARIQHVQVTDQSFSLVTARRVE